MVTKNLNNSQSLFFRNLISKRFNNIFEQILILRKQKINTIYFRRRTLVNKFMLLLFTTIDFAIKLTFSTGIIFLNF